ncbi:hypothetical protein BDF19DRAFT_443913, partial [Syncephalis fuscata]
HGAFGINAIGSNIPLDHYKSKFTETPVLPRYNKNDNTYSLCALSNKLPKSFDVIESLYTGRAPQDANIAIGKMYFSIPIRKTQGNGQTCYIMQYEDTTPLEYFFLGNRPNYNHDQVLDIIKQIVTAVKYMKSKGWIYNENITYGKRLTSLLFNY